MKFFFRIFFMNIFLSFVKAGLTVSKVVVRVPRENDIGLIFDLCITNSKEGSPRERLQFSIRAADGCNLDLGGKRAISPAGHIVGGSFGCIEPGATETVSLIWPTISLYNRVGCCPIIITSTNLNGQQFHLRQTLPFDTKYESLDPQRTGIRKSKKFKDCNNFDLDYLNDCKPVNCEERYFGLRNYFNGCTKRCEPVPPCQGEMLYDPFTNECIDCNYAVTSRDIHDIKQGFFKNYEEWNTEISRNSYHQKFLRHIKRESSEIGSEDLEAIDNADDDALRASWVKGVIDGLMLVFATIGIYVIICFLIFVIVSCISRRQGTRNSISFSAPPSVSERGIPLRSRTSLASRR